MADTAKKKSSGERKSKTTKPVNEKPKKSARKPVKKLAKKLTKKLTKKQPAVKAVVKVVKAVRKAAGKAAEKAAGKSVEARVETAGELKAQAGGIEERWFWVSALYKLTPTGDAVLSPERINQWERRVFVVRAARGDERRVARRVAKEHETRHNVPQGEKAIWQLQDVEAYAELFDEKIESGTEVYWQFLAGSRQ